MADWAEERAREWLERHSTREATTNGCRLVAGHLYASVNDLADLLREDRARTLAEVRLVVEEVMEDRWPADVFTPPPPGQHGGTVDACSAAALRAVVPKLRDEILARLDSL